MAMMTLLDHYNTFRVKKYRANYLGLKLYTNQCNYIKITTAYCIIINQRRWTKPLLNWETCFSSHLRHSLASLMKKKFAGMPPDVRYSGFELSIFFGLVNIFWWIFLAEHAHINFIELTMSGPLWRYTFPYTSHTPFQIHNLIK